MLTQKLNLPENFWKSPAIKRRLSQEARFECDYGISEKPLYWVMVPAADTRDGLIVLKNYEPDLINADPHEMQQEFAKQIYRALQYTANFDGLWIVGFTHPPSNYETLTDTGNCWGRLIAIWLDQHGDPQYTLESDLPFVNQIEAGIEYYVGLAHKCHSQWSEQYSSPVMKTDMLLTDDQMKPAALESLKGI